MNHQMVQALVTVTFALLLEFECVFPTSLKALKKYTLRTTVWYVVSHEVLLFEETIHASMSLRHVERVAKGCCVQQTEEGFLNNISFMTPFLQLVGRKVLTRQRRPQEPHWGGDVINSLDARLSAKASRICIADWKERARRQERVQLSRQIAAGWGEGVYACRLFHTRKSPILVIPLFD